MLFAFVDDILEIPYKIPDTSACGLLHYIPFITNSYVCSYMLRSLSTNVVVQQLYNII